MRSFHILLIFQKIRESALTTLPDHCLGLAIRRERRCAAFGVRMYDVRCMCIQRSVYVHTTFDVRHRQNRKWWRNGWGGDDTKMLFCWNIRNLLICNCRHWWNCRQAVERLKSYVSGWRAETNIGLNAPWAWECGSALTSLLPAFLRNWEKKCWL